jgi:hypothetical protein
LIDFADVVGLHEAFGNHRRRAEKFTFAKADRDVAIVGGGETARVQTAADLADLFFEFEFVHDSSFVSCQLSVARISACDPLFYD